MPCGEPGYDGQAHVPGDRHVSGWRVFQPPVGLSHLVGVHADALSVTSTRTPPLTSVRPVMSTGESGADSDAARDIAYLIGGRQVGGFDAGLADLAERIGQPHLGCS
jgi:hypothetical protein